MAYSTRLQAKSQPTAPATDVAASVETDSSQRKAIESAIRDRERRYRDVIEDLGVAVYATDAQGRITLFNEAAVELWGRRPRIGKDEWCGSWRLFWPDGRPLRHDECPMAITLKENRPVRGVEAVAERPDGTRVSFLPFPTPLRDDNGDLVGAVNVLIDTTERTRAEAELERRYSELEGIHSLAAAVNAVISAEDTYTQALEAVMKIVHPDRAALLLLDGDGVARFKAWRNLSDGYREAVTGHFPWSLDDSSPQPVLVDDVNTDTELKAFLDTILNEGIGALAFIPLCADGRLIGKFMLYYDTPHVFTPEEVQLASTVANSLALALARRTAQEDRERLLTQLEAERQRISDVISDVPGVVWAAYGRPDSALQRIDFVSDYIKGMTGYEVEEWLSTPNFWLTIVHPEDRERAAAESTAIFTSGKDGRNEFRWVAKDGRVIPVEAHSTVIKGEAGEPIGMRGVTLDITARKAAEEALRSAEAQLTMVTNAIPALISYVDASNRYVYNNEAYEAWFGDDPQSLKGRHLRDVLGASAYRKLLPHIRRALAGEVVRFEDRLPYSSGGPRWVHAEYIPHRTGGNVAGFVALITDISDRKEAEQAAFKSREEAERRLSEEAAINRIAELLQTTLDLETLCQVALAEATRVTVTEFGIMAVRSGDDARVVATRNVPEPALEPFQELRPAGETALARALFEGRAIYSPRGAGSARFLKETGATRFAVVPLIARGAVVGALEIAGRFGRSWGPEDRTFLRRIAGHIALAVSNAQAYQSIEDAYRRRDEGVRALSHEIRTPLTALKGFSQLALRQVERGSLDEARLKDSLQEISAASDRLVRVAEQMLTASTVESGITHMNKETVPLGRFLRRAIAEFTAEQRPCPVKLHPVPRVSLRIDVQLIRQVIWNLLANAMKFSPPGQPVFVSAARQGNQAVVSVSDSGPGVPEEDQESLFEKFQTGSANGEKGLGLGLYLARQVVEAHGGTIWYEPDQRQGARFSFTLPARRFRS